MARYFLHLHQCGDVTRDPEGHDLPDLEAALRVAIEAARDVMCGELATGVLCLACYIDIADPDGNILVKVLFKDAVKVTGV